MSSASKPNCLNVEPDSIAASDKLTSREAAKSKVADVIFNIWSVVKPSLANSVCNSTTCVALNAVEAPNFLALSDRFFISVLVAPDTAFKPLNVLPNSLPFLNALTKTPPTAANPETSAPIPRALIDMPILSKTPPRPLPFWLASFALLPVLSKPLLRPLTFFSASPVFTSILYVTFFAIF